MYSTLHKLTITKRLASELEDLDVPSSKKTLLNDSLLFVLACAGQERYGGQLIFDIGYSSKGRHVIVSSKSCHWHPPAGVMSRTRLVVQEDGYYYFQVLLLPKDDGKIDTTDHFLSVCEMMVSWMISKEITNFAQE